MEFKDFCRVSLVRAPTLASSVVAEEGAGRDDRWS